jgi:hypothetical protein
MRIRTILAAAAAPAALAAVVLGTTAGPASAATNPGTGAVVITSQDQLNQLAASGTITKNIDVPAGYNVGWLSGTTVNGNITIEGQMTMNGDTVNGNVTVSGGGPAGSASQLWLANNPSHITGNLTITGSAGGPNGNGSNNGTSFGDNANESWGPTLVTQVDGNFSFTNNTGWLYVGAPLHVGHNFTASGNGPYTWDGAFNYGNVSAAKTSVVTPTYSS